jgi:hypothetical protein
MWINVTRFSRLVIRYVIPGRQQASGAERNSCEWFQEFFAAKMGWWFLSGESRVTSNELRVPKAWHIWRDWSFTPFVVVVGSKYFLPAPECLLFDRAIVGSRPWLRPIPPRRVWGGFDAWPQ